MYNKVLVPVSLAEEVETQKAFDIARMMAGSDGVVCAVHVIETVASFAETYFPAEARQQWEQSAKDRFAEILPDDMKQSEVLHGAAGATILAYAKKIDADCIVVASHRPGLANYFLGSTAARVVRYAQCSVHVLR